MITGGTFNIQGFVPNPSRGNTNLLISASVAQEITVEIYDMLGQRVMSDSHQLRAGMNEINYNLGFFASGTYTALVRSTGEVYTQKLVITK